jgi:transcription initiation factor TFIIB
MDRCPECGGFEIDLCSDGMHCRNCGLVLDESPIDKEYIGSSPSSIPEMAVAGSAPINGNIVRHHFLISTREKNLFKAKKRLAMISSRLRLPSRVEKEANLIFRRAVDKNLNIGRDNASMLYASVYASCILHDIPKTPLEVIAFTSVRKNRMLNAFKVIKKELNLQLDRIDPIDFVQRFGSRLDLKQSTMTLASEIIEKLKKKGLTEGRQPKTIVASALYVSSRINRDYRTQREVANATGVIEVTIRKRSMEIVESLEFN